MKLLRKWMTFQQLEDLDLFEDVMVNSRIDFFPTAGCHYRNQYRAWKDANLTTHIVKEWQESWYSKVLNGPPSNFNEIINQIGIQQTARAYATLGTSDFRPRSIVFFKNPDDILIIKMGC